MKTIQFKAKEVAEPVKNVEITLPFYAKDNRGHFCKVINDKKMLQVFVSEHQNDLINTVPFYLGEGWSDWEQIEEDEFKTAFEKANSNLKNLLEA